MKGYIAFENESRMENLILGAAYCSKKTALAKAKEFVSPHSKVVLSRVESGNKIIYQNEKGERYFEI